MWQALRPSCRILESKTLEEKTVQLALGRYLCQDRWAPSHGGWHGATRMLGTVNVPVFRPHGDAPSVCARGGRPLICSCVCAEHLHPGRGNPP